ncbi:MAG: hypothetical protein IJ427_04150 [Lachnospiraceae bacterium]|nr:hypothetical protein [Lachnospiraceae bacterium]MBQ8547671.1 hypothetical protein [Lachnospiraceae bacterium]MBQ8846407.1 hypothetical protein [Lachnospiraceae bacterium]
MDSKIEITLKSHMSFLNKAITYSALFVLFIWFMILYLNFSAGGLISFLLFLGAFILYQYILNKRPTVVTADSEKLVYKQLFSSKEFLLTDIDRISCEPYVVNGRYHSEQRIRVMVYTREDELELSDHVDTNAVLNDTLEEKETDIPLIRLYRFLMKQTGRWE